MKYLKTLLLLTILLPLTIQTAVAHVSPVAKIIPGPKDPKAKAVLDSICQHYDEIKSMEVDMVLTNRFRNTTKIDTISGFREGRKYRLEMPGRDVVYDGKKVWFYDKATKEIFNRESNPEETNFLYPSKTLKNWEKQFNYSIIGELNLGDHTFLKMEFTSKEKNHGSQTSPRINLFVDKRNFQILKITVTQSNGDFLMLDYHNFKTNVKFDPSVFVLGIS